MSASPDGLGGRFEDAWRSLSGIGRRPDGGYDRFSWTEADLEMRRWFRAQADERSLAVEQDRNGNLWAGWEDAAARGDAVVTGSHLDSVPAGGAFDGPLGVLAGFLALDVVREADPASAPRIAVAAFTEEEGARFGVACLGSRLMTGSLHPQRALELVDRDGTDLASAMRQAGADPGVVGADHERTGRIASYVELHIEQGRRLHHVGRPIGIASGIWPHGRWRLVFQGKADHAGTARIEDRHDPVLPFADAVGAARAAATSHGGLATVGRVDVLPGATNGVAATARAWLDARAPEEASLARLVAEVRARAERAAAHHGVSFEMTEESVSPGVELDGRLRTRMARVLPGAPELATGAGHDAGVLAERVPSAMLFVRNPSGVSHSPTEQATLDDCVAGVRALASVLADLARP